MARNLKGQASFVTSAQDVRALALAGVAAMLIAAAGCGSAPVVVNSSVLRLRLEEYRIVPGLVQVRPGRLKIIAYDTGILAHNVVVEETYLDRYGSPIMLGGTPTAMPGQSVSGKVTLKPGKYKLVDTVADHAGLGAYATLIVK